MASMPKRNPRASKRKGLSERKRAAVLVLLLLAVFLVSFVSYGLAYRGNVVFTFGGNNEIRRSYQLTAMSEYRPSTIDITHIRIRNSGGTGITVIVTMHALNAVVSVEYSGPYSNSAGVQLYLPAGGGYQVINFYLTLPVQVASFTIRVTVGQVVDFSSISTLATSSLASIQPAVPTTLIYAQESGNSIIYQLTGQY